ncbi:MAG: autotransporter-associated beta strand repeat-containing protein, partial [Prosthecobacter sp.]
NITFNSNGYTIADADADSIFSLSTGSIITVTTGAHVATISEDIAAGDITKAGAGVLLLSGSNTFDGAVGVSAGTLRLGSNSALGSTVGATSVSGTAIIELQNGVTIGETITVGSGGDNYGGLRAGASASATLSGSILLNPTNRLGALNNGLLDVTGVISNGTTSGLQIATTGSSTATLGIVRISTAATYTGTTSIIRGRLQLGIEGALPATTVVAVDTATALEDSIFDLNGHTQTIAGLARTNNLGTGGGSFVLNSSATAATLTITNASTQTYAGIIQDGTGVLNIVKSGTGTQTFSGDNTYTGTTSVSAGSLILSGSNTLPGAISVTGGALTLSGTNTLGGNISVTTGGALTLSAANTISPTASILVTGGSSVLTVGNSGSLGAPGGTTITVSLAGRIVLNDGVTITGKTLSLSAGGNNNGALQSASGATATWAGNIITTSGDTRIGGGDTGGNLIVNGVISGTGGILYSRANNSTTTLNGLATYTGDTQLFANAGTGSRLVIGVDNALTSTRLSVIGTVATVAMTLDLNGHPITLTAADTTANHLSGNVLFVQNNGVAPATLTFSGAGISTEQMFNGRINDGTSGTGGVSLTKNGTNVQTLVNSNGYTGVTTVNLGTLQIGKTTGAATYTGSNGALASTTIILSGNNGIAASSGTLAIDNLGTSNNSASRLADSASISFRGGILVYRGSDQAATNSTETVGSLVAHSRRSLLTMTYGSTNTAVLTADSFSRPANGGLLIVNGVNLGLDGTGTASVSRILFTTAPDLVGTGLAASTGIGTAKNLQIVPGMVGEATATSGGAGTATGTPNTFLTYNPDTGLRPLNPTDEFSTSFIAGDNVRVTAATTVSSSMSINSLVVSGATGATTYGTTIGAGKTLTIASGSILFTGGTSMTFGNGGTIAFGTREGIITTFSAGNTTINSLITGTAGVSYYGTGTLVTNQQHAYTGNTGLYLGAAIPQVSSIGTPGAPTAGPFGTGTLILGGAGLRATTSTSIVLHNNVDFRVDTTMISGSTTSTFSFLGAVSLSNGTRTLTNSSDANTFFSGVISETAPGSGLTIAGTSARAVVLSGANTYTGPTTVSSNTTLVINGNQSAATGAVNVNAGTLGGMGTVGGAITVASGATLSPGDVTATNTSLNGTLSSASSLTLKSGSATNLQITTATFTSADSFGYNEPGSAGYIAYVIANGNAAGSAGTAHDKLIFTSLTQETGGKITVSNAAFTPVAGQIFNLLDWTDLSTFSGNLGPSSRDGASDSAFDLDLPDISASGYLWDTSFFASHGIIVVTPEPGRALLLGIGMAMLGLRRRRR